jgi:hypothetical protein
MAVQTPSTSGEQHIIGDMVFRNYVFTTTINNGDTWTPTEKRIEALIIQPTTAQYVGFTIAAGVVTFAASAGFVGRIGVIARIR